MPDVANSRSLTRNKHELFDHVLAAILKSGKEGVFQTEICREFSLDSRDGSRLAGNLEKQSLISREKGTSQRKMDLQTHCKEISYG